MKRTLPLKGIHCASCVSNVEKILSGIKGVSESQINLALKTLSLNVSSLKVLNQIKIELSKGGYELILDSKTTSSDLQIKEIEDWQNRLIISAIFGIPLFFIAMGEMIGLPQLFSGNYSNYIQLILTSIIILIGLEFFRIGFKKLFLLNPDMNSLISLGTTAAFGFSIFSTFNQSFHLGWNGFDHVYFESAGIILLFITTGRYLEAKAKGKASEALQNLLKEAPKTALVKRDENWKEIPIVEIEIDDLVRIKPGEKIPVDGIVVEGVSHVDESIITGESIPVKKEIGHHVISPGINTSGTLVMKAEKVGAETVYNQIIRMVEEAQFSKAPIQSLADKIAGIFVPIVLLLAIGSFSYWIYIGETIEFATNILVSVLIIACPCSLGLATPTALVVGLGIGAQRGVHFRNATAIQNLAKVNSLVFDKTGTITSGNISVTDVVTEQNDEIFKSYFKSIEFLSEHILAKSIVNSFPESKLLKIKDFKIIEGFGVSGILNDRPILTGSLRFMDNQNIKLTDENKELDLKLQSQGKTVVHLAYDRLWMGLIAVADTIRDESDFLVYKLKKMNIELSILSGDNPYTTKFIADQVGIFKYKSEMLPTDKNEQIQKLKSEGNIVAMAGDGINDAPSLVEADVGITLSTGTEIAAESSDVVLMKPDLRGILTAFTLSKFTMQKIKLNLFWAFAYNILSIPIAMGLLYLGYGFLLSPMVAGGAMALSSVSVVLNSVSLKLKKIN